MPYRWVQNPGATDAAGTIQAGMDQNKVVNAAHAAGRDARMISQGKAEQLGFLQSPDLAGAIDRIKSSYASAAFSDSPEQQQEAQQQHIREATQDNGINKINQVNSAYMGLRGMQMQGQENAAGRDIAYRMALAKSQQDAYQREKYTNGWGILGGYLAGGLAGAGQVMAGM